MFGRRSHREVLENIERLERETGVAPVPVPRLPGSVRRRKYEWLEERGGLVLGGERREALAPFGSAASAMCSLPQGFVVNELNGAGAGLRKAQVGALLYYGHR